MSRRGAVAAGIGLALAVFVIDALTPGDIEDAATLLALAGLAVAPIVGLFSTRYVWHIYRLDERRPRSSVLRLLLVVCIISTIVAFYLATLGVLRLGGFRLPDWTVLGLAVACDVLVSVPAIIAYTIRRRVGIEIPKG